MLESGPMWAPLPCLPTPMNPTASRSLGAAAESAPRALAEMIVGAATARAAPLTNSRRLGDVRLRMWVPSLKMKMTTRYPVGEYNRDAELLRAVRLRDGF